MTFSRRKFLYFAASAAAPLAATRVALAQSWPARPVRVVVGYPAGITPDIVARLVAQRLSARLGQPFIVDNKPGAGTSIAAEEVVRAQPDGYTLLLAAAANTINTSLYSNLNFNFNRDIAAVANIGGVIFLMGVNPTVPAKTIPELIAYAKANPGKLNIASRGIGSLTHVFGELFKMMAGVNLVHVPYRGDYTADLLGGRVQVAFFAIADAIGYVKGGRMRALAVTTAKRFAQLPDLPPLPNFYLAMRRPDGSVSVRPGTRPTASSKGSTAKSTPPSPIRPSESGSLQWALNRRLWRLPISANSSRPKPTNGRRWSPSPTSSRISAARLVAKSSRLSTVLDDG